DQKKLTEAEAAYRQAIALKPDFAWAYHHLGIALAAQKKLADAVEAFCKADQLLPDDPDIRDTLHQAERSLRLERKLAAYLTGKERPGTPQEFAQIADCAT